MRTEHLLMARVEAVCHYLLFKRNIDDKLELYKDTIMCPEFVNEFLTVLKSSITYPKHAKENAYKIIDKFKNIIDKEKVDYLKQLVENKKYSYDIYEAEFSLRHNSINFEKDYFVWTLDDMEQAVEFDILFLNSLLAGEKKFLKDYSAYFVLNPHFLGSVNKYALLKPYIFDEDALIKIVNIINVNRDMINDNKNALSKEYIMNSTDPIIKAKLERLEWLYTMTDNTLVAIMNLNKSKFMLVTLRLYYERIGIEEYLYNDNRMDTDWISLMSVYKYIEAEQNIDNIAKRRLIELLSSKRGTPKGDDLEEYNRHLRKLNGLTESIYDHAFTDIFHKTEKIAVPGYGKQTIEEKAIMDDIKKSLKTNLKTFDVLLKQDIDFQMDLIQMDPEYVYSVVKFINEMPSLFMNSQLNLRARLILEENRNKVTKESIKVLEKMVGID